jgi:invasion protein IalB
MKQSLLSLAALTMTAFGVTAPAAQAAEPKLQGTYSDWSVYTRTDGGDRICYVLAKPEVKAPTNVRHGDVFFMVANWKSGAAKEQPSLLAGYSLKTTRAPAAYVGSTKVLMYAADNEAFIESTADEKNLVRKMRAGADMRVEAVSARGTETSYVFSLKGITAALRKARSVCG